MTSTHLAALWDRYRDRPFVFVRPGGNHGDYLIYAGAEALARHVGVEFETVTHDAFMAAEYPAEVVVYLHGSGGFNPLYDGDPMKELAKAGRHAGVAIQGPATFWDDPAFIAERVAAPLTDVQCERLVVMARERVSHGLIDGALPDTVEVVLDHDTAFNAALEPDTLGGTLDAPLPQYRGRGYPLYAMRTDEEAYRARPGQTVLTPWGDPAGITATLDGWVRLHAGARYVVTNRLHSAIVSSLLGVPTTLTANDYFKNRAVWEHSLQGSTVQWGDAVPLPALSRTLTTVPLLGDLLTRGPYPRAVRRLYGLPTS